jgi:hypothetical protein
VLLKKMSRRLIFLSVAVFVSVAAKGADQVGNAEWKARMQAMLGNVLVLFPFAFDRSKFNDPKNAATIQSSLKNLVAHSSELKNHTSHMKPEDGLKIDPSFPIIADAFAADLMLAQSTYLMGENFQANSQGYLRSALSKCMMCHTQSANGPELKLDQFKSQFAALSTTDRFMALTATRQFDAALKEFDQYVANSKVTKPDAVTFDEGVRAALAIVVRVKRDSKRALSLIDEIADSGAGTSMLQHDLKGWKKAVLAWQAEKPVSLLSAQALFDEAERLIESGKKQESIETSESPAIGLLRASAYLHDLLSNYSNSPLRAKSYLLLASVYDSLPGFAIWDLADEYLESCIQENPHSEIGEKCFAQYDDNTTIGYTGSSGTHIPEAVREHIDRMHALAKRIQAKK